MLSGAGCGLAWRDLCQRISQNIGCDLGSADFHRSPVVGECHIKFEITCSVSLLVAARAAVEQRPSLFIPTPSSCSNTARKGHRFPDASNAPETPGDLVSNLSRFLAALHCYLHKAILGTTRHLAMSSMAPDASHPIHTHAWGYSDWILESFDRMPRNINALGSAMPRSPAKIPGSPPKTFRQPRENNLNSFSTFLPSGVESDRWTEGKLYEQDNYR